LVVLAWQDCGFHLREPNESLDAFKRAETLDRFGDETAAALHPYHFKIFHMYLNHLDQAVTVGISWGVDRLGLWKVDVIWKTINVDDLGFLW